MKRVKRGISFTLGFSFVCFISLINLVSAYNGYYYGKYSFSDILSNIDPSLINLGAIFIISFAILFFSLSKFFKTKEGPNKAIAGVVAFALALLITYQVNRTGFDFKELFYNIGISSEIFSILIPLLIIGAVIFLIVMFKSATLLVFGALLIIISFTKLVYQRGIMFILGIILAGIGLWLISKKKKNGKEYKIRIQK